MEVKIVEGILADFKADVIVNSTNQALMLDLGGLSMSISKAAGPGLQAECSRSYPNGISFGELASTDGYGLKCKKVYHVSICAWDSNVADGKTVLNLVMSECLRRAHEDRMTSVAFPTLGCGFLGHPPDIVARTMKECIENFEGTFKDTALKQLFIVVFTKARDWRHVKQAFQQVFANDERLTHGRKTKTERMMARNIPTGAVVPTCLPRNNDDRLLISVADNWDHNECTLSGKGSTHAMTSILVSTSHGTNSSPRFEPSRIHRVQEMSLNTSSLPGGGLAHTLVYKKPAERPSPRLNPPVELDELNPTESDNVKILKMKELLYHMKRNQRIALCDARHDVDTETFPTWSVYQSKFETDNIFEPVEIMYNPIIMANPTNLNTVYTTLKRTKEQIQALGQKVCPIVFDMGLLMKALEITWSNPTEFEGIIPIEGGMHYMMSVFGGIGNIYGNAGLKELLYESEVFAKNTVDHILSGKDFDRALKALLMVDEVMNRRFMHQFRLWAKNEISVCNLDMQLKQLHLHDLPILQNGIPPELEQLIQLEIQPLIEKFRLEGRTVSPTFRFWDSYLTDVSMPMKLFLSSSRHAIWDVNKYAKTKLLPFLFSSNRSNYMKFMPYQVLAMNRIPEALSACFEKGLFVSKLSRGRFNSVWYDYMLEVTENKALKSSGGIIGITHNENALTRWFMSRPLTARFKAENPGTHFWHAHTGMQRSDGIFGAFVVRQTDDNEDHLGLYEEDLAEHTMVINDWIGEMGIDRYAHYQHSDGDDEPESILVNGKGMYKEFVTDDQTKLYTHVEVFHVTEGKRYRFRVISAATMNCPIQVSIDDHSVTVIASDGGTFEKIDVDSFNIFAGERYDFVLNASMSVANYWIRFRGLADCGEKNATQVAILRYIGAGNMNPPGTITWEDGEREGKLLNPLNKKPNESYVPVVNLKSLVAGGAALKAVADKTFYLAMDFNKVDNYYYQHKIYYPISATEKGLHTYMPQINRVSMTLPHAPPLYQHGQLDENIYCNYETLGSRNCSAEFCECVHRLKVDLGDVVEFVIIGESVNIQANHPMHLHGYRFFVVGMGMVGETTSLEEIKRLDAQGNLTRNLVDPVAKDTVTVPDGGYTIIRFQANNPGFWFFHCHIQFHLSIGMGLLVQVGEAENMPSVPHDFPRCGNWKFTEKSGQENNECASGTVILSSSHVTALFMILVMTVQKYTCISL